MESFHRHLHPPKPSSTGGFQTWLAGTQPPWRGHGDFPEGSLALGLERKTHLRHRWHVGILARHAMGEAHPIFLYFFWGLEHYYFYQLLVFFNGKISQTRRIQWETPRLMEVLVGNSSMKGDVDGEFSIARSECQSASSFMALILRCRFMYFFWVRCPFWQPTPGARFSPFPHLNPNISSAF